jgi:hypothetical protein
LFHDVRLALVLFNDASLLGPALPLAGRFVGAKDFVRFALTTDSNSSVQVSPRFFVISSACLSAAASATALAVPAAWLLLIFCRMQFRGWI